jgi:hypothetical protein
MRYDRPVPRIFDFVPRSLHPQMQNGVFARHRGCLTPQAIVKCFKGSCSNDHA